MFITWLQSFLSIAFELTILFIGISFLISLLQGLIPYEKINRYLSGNNTVLGVLAALLFAFITPFCSCSTIPVVVNLLNKKVRFGIVMVFLFSSPVLDPTIITLMGALLGIKVAVAYTVITSILSVAIGLTLEKLGFEKAVKQVVMTGYEEKTQRFSWTTAWAETLSMMKTVYPYLIIGAAIGSVIHGVVPADWISSVLGGEQWWLVPIAAVIGIPLYIRLSMMIPMSQILLAKGMALAPVMALMISSAGASLPEIALLGAIFQRRLVVAFIVSVLIMATLSGYLFYFL
ncbi:MULTISPECIES: permease [Brevibacillus]|uniref:permease n=1 Tax=Brevibacillus TaxID=55080 RepID=UPI00203D6A50|nr:MULTISPECIES: permease [Brevibacillus]MCM3080188.1 permease [Brevibacillus invocatus]MCM3430366.1 permease [Brevibacillus invocatus]MDH4619172.1 permease [Brevibacillus sp. AY1]